MHKIKGLYERIFTESQIKQFIVWMNFTVTFSPFECEQGMLHLLTFVCVAVSVNISYSLETGKLVRLQILFLYIPFHFDTDFMKHDVKF
jgi:hypothetical protein